MELQDVLAYLDGRLPATERVAAEAWLATPQGRETQRALAALRSAVRPGQEPLPCEQLEDTCALADGALAGAARTAAEAHLLGCPGCFEAYADLVVGAGAGAGAAPAFPAGELAVLGEAPAARPAGKVVTHRRWWQGGAAGLAAAGLVMFVLWRPTMQGKFELPAGHGDVAGSGTAITTGVFSDLKKDKGMFAGAAPAASPELRVSLLLQALDLDGGDLASRLELAREYERLGRRELAVKHYHLLQEALLRRGSVADPRYAESAARLEALEK